MVILLLALGAAQGDELPAPVKTAWGRIEWKADAALLHVDAWPADGRIAMPRLHNPIGPVYVQGDAAKAALTLQPNLADWSVSKPKTGDAAAIIVTVIGRPRLAGDVPPVAVPAADGSISLPAHAAVTHGRLLRYEPQPHKNTVGYWADAGDWCEWRFRVEKPRKYKVILLQGCGKGQGGSAIKVIVAGQALEYTVEDTGHFQNFVEREAGSVTIDKAGVAALEIRAVRKAKGAVMDLRQVKLVPVE